VAGESVQGPGTVPVPRVEQQGAAPPPDREFAGADTGDTDGESGGEDQAVEFVLDTADYHAVFGDPLDPVRIRRIDQGDIAAVECRIVVVGERGSLTGVPIPGREFFRRLRIRDRLPDAVADIVHLDGVRDFVSG